MVPRRAATADETAVRGSTLRAVRIPSSASHVKDLLHQ